jgi:DNA-binding response OmpR family regulator
MRLLVVEDELKLAEVMRNGLVEEGFEVEIAGSGEMAIQKILEQTFDAFILDIMLPEMDGIQLCTKLRDSGITRPILMLTARNGLNDKVSGLNAGADDYLTKPFEFEELVARLRALLRKTTGYHRNNLTVADLVIDPKTKQVMRAGKQIELSKKEYALLEYLVQHQDRVLTRAMIARAVWESDTITYTNIIDVFINYLRKKVDQDHPVKLIRTVRGKGFIISADKPGKDQLENHSAGNQVAGDDGTAME